MPSNSAHITAGQTTLYNQGDDHAYVYEVLTGYVILFGDSRAGKHCILNLLGAGSYFGPGLNSNSVCHGARTKPGCQLQRAHRTEFQQQLQAQPELASVLIEQLSERELRLHRQLMLRQTGDLPQRLAGLLLELLNSQGQPCQHGHLVDVQLSQQELADMVGGSRQSVSQCLAAWKREGIIDYERSFICLEKPAALRAYTIG